MKTLLLVAILSFLPSAFAQTFMAKQSEAILSFKGTLLTKGINRKAAVTFRETATTQDLTIVMEVKHFTFPDSYQQDEFNETFMESHYFPQIRISGSLKEKIDVNADGIYIVNFPAKVTIRKISQNVMIKTRLEITGKELKVSFEQILQLADYMIPYASEGSEIGKDAGLSLNSLLERVQ